MKILVVDDERSLGVLLGLRLRRLGHQPLLALHPHDALAMLGNDIDAVITDIDMPGMDGIELAKAIREIDEEMPIAFCTGSDPKNERVRKASTIGPVLPKTWTQDQIKALVNELARWRSSPGLALGSGVYPPDGIGKKA